MATHVFGPGCDVHFGSVDLAGRLTSVALSQEADAVDLTTLQQSSRIMGGGLKTWTATLSGHYQASSDGGSIFAAVGSKPGLSIWPDGRTAGDPAYFGVTRAASLTELGALGDIAPFELVVQGGTQTDAAPDSHVLTRGVVGIRSTSVAAQDGTGVNFGAVASGQTIRMYGHLFNIAGGSSPYLVAFLESAAADSWGSPTSHIGPTIVSSPGSFISASAAGPVTDTWWRVRVAFVGSPTSASFSIGFAIS